jgi:hypothetical protein
MDGAFVKGGKFMGRYAMAAAFTLVLAGAAMAGKTQYFVVQDPVGNCAVVDSKPAAHSGMRVMGPKSGFSTKEEAKSAMKGMGGKCKGTVG